MRWRFRLSLEQLTAFVTLLTDLQLTKNRALTAIRTKLDGLNGLAKPRKLTLVALKFFVCFIKFLR